jgi:hypothetical protein
MTNVDVNDSIRNKNETNGLNYWRLHRAMDYHFSTNERVRSIRGQLSEDLERHNNALLQRNRLLSNVILEEPDLCYLNETTKCINHAREQFRLAIS